MSLKQFYIIILTLSLLFVNTSRLVGSEASRLDVQSFILEYGLGHPELIPLEEVYKAPLELRLKDDVWEEPADGEPIFSFPIGKLPPNAVFSESGLQTALQQLLNFFNERGYSGVFVLPSEKDIDALTGEDKRAETNKNLTLVIWISQIEKVRSLGRGKRYEKDETVANLKQHQKIIHHSPLKGDNEKGEGSPIRKKTLDQYISRLNRHPNRRVDVTLAAGTQPGKAVLDYLVNEAKPWLVYAQYSNTGTPNTGEWRGRLGFLHYQLTESDDSLSADYITSDTEESRAVLLSYERPIIFPDHLRVRAYGSWSEYQSEELGLGLANPRFLGFRGRTWTAGTEAIFNLFHYQDIIVDALFGGRWENIFVKNDTVRTEGQVDLAIGYLGLRAQRQKGIVNTQGSATLEYDFHDIDSEKLVQLGRLDVDDNWSLIKGNLGHTFFLEPLFFPNEWENPETWQKSTLAHEINLNLSSQYTFSNQRLIPQQQFVTGGFFSVRGYPESVASGDNGYLFNAEYRLHVPRLLKPADLTGNGKIFDRYYLRPPSIYAYPDWDFLVRLFFDSAYVGNNRKRFDEENFDLQSIGGGFELQLLKQLKVRLDYGYILTTLKREGVILEDAEKGDTRTHFLTTFSW